MPYAKVSDLPEGIQNLPSHAKKIYLKSFNHAWREYASPLKRRLGSDREETACRVAWSAIKRLYKKSGKQWVKK